MTNHLRGVRIAVVLMVLIGGALEGRADTILSISGSEAVFPGTPVNTLELMDLGIDPNLFLFTGNTFYNYTGMYQIQVIGAEVDPRVTDSLDGVMIQTVLLTIGDTGDGGAAATIGANGIVTSQATPSAVPEPKLAGAAGIAMLLGIWWYQVRRSGARRSLS